MIEQCAGVNCWFVGWYNALCELYCNCPIYNLHKSDNSHVLMHKTSESFALTPLQCTALACFVRVTFNRTLFYTLILHDQIYEWTDSKVQNSSIFSYSLLVISNELAYI